MIILGLNYYFHDSSACIVKDGKLIIALEEERLSREKHTYKFPEMSIDRCLKESNINADEIDAIAISIKPELDWVKKFFYIVKNFPKSATLLKYELKLYLDRKQQLNNWLKKTWPNNKTRPEIHFIAHHLSHAAGSFYVSPYESAAILSIDGSGEWASSLLASGNGLDVTTLSEPTYFPHSLGSVYEAITQFCGFKPCHDEGKTMGLAPMGDASKFYDIAKNIISVNKQGNIKVDTSYFNFQYWKKNLLSHKFIQTFGPPRKPSDKDFQNNHLNVAAAFQKVLEDTCLEMINILKQKTNEKYLVISGGVALNSVMNGRVVRESEFDDIYVMPAAGDNGTSIGAAYYVLHKIYAKPRNYVHDNPYVGTEYSNDEIKKIIDKCKLKYEYHENIEKVTAKYLFDGEIICWFQGKMEIGPRALGNRSILANPATPEMKDKINAEVKHREAYRPFAPSATLECKDQFFDLSVEAPFMLKVCNVLKEKREVLAAITHVDGSARLQTVNRNTNPRYHKLLSEFGTLSGIPVLLNTSFNVMGQPIVESPEQAIKCFYGTGLDKLVMGNYLISK